MWNQHSSESHTIHHHTLLSSHPHTLTPSPSHPRPYILTLSHPHPHTHPHPLILTPSPPSHPHRWAMVHRAQLQHHGSTLEFHLRQRKFLSLLSTGRTQEALAYAKVLGQFVPKHTPGIPQLVSYQSTHQVYHS